jgi:hypothetical protein
MCLAGIEPATIKGFRIFSHKLKTLPSELKAHEQIYILDNRVVLTKKFMGSCALSLFPHTMLAGKQLHIVLPDASMSVQERYRGEMLVMH